MLAGLNDIDWKNLEHAYGSAEDIPGLLVSLLGSKEARNKANFDLASRIVHQGTVYSASAAVVPFLVNFLIEGGLSVEELVGWLCGLYYIGTSRPHFQKE